MHSLFITDPRPKHNPVQYVYHFLIWPRLDKPLEYPYYHSYTHGISMDISDRLDSISAFCVASFHLLNAQRC